MARKKSAAKKAKEAAAVADGTNEVKDVVEEESQSQQQEQKQKKNNNSIKEHDLDDESDESSSSEEEDEYGDLATEKVDTGINNILDILRSNPNKLLDKDLKFFDNPEDDDIPDQIRKEKPMYLKDYHRMNLLSGNYKNDDEDSETYNTVDGEKPYTVEQRDERNQLLSDINNAFSGDEQENEEEDDFLKKKDSSHKDVNEAHISLPDPNSNQEEFLNSFIGQRAWIPTEGDKVINLDKHGDDDEDFDNAVDDFENAYNFRYEDPNSAEIISYARNQATLRRDKTNARKRKREMKSEEKQKEKQQKEEIIKKKETSKLNKAMDRLAQIKEAIGGDIDDLVIQKVFGDSLLNEDFDDTDWDSKMAEIFNEQYYGEDDQKPTWDNADIESDNNEEKVEQDDDVEQSEQDDDVEQAEQSEEPQQKKSKKDKLKEKKEAKRLKESLKEQAKALVEANKAKIIEEVEEEENRGRSTDDDMKFKYREVSPESFNLTTRDIFLADDKQLNSYLGIKRYAPYRPKEQRVKDRRKYKKKRPIEEWRREVFRGYKPKEGEGDDDNSIWIPIEEKHKKKKHKSKA